LDKQRDITILVKILFVEVEMTNTYKIRVRKLRRELGNGSSYDDNTKKDLKGMGCEVIS
jgi:hypothetical protein